MADDEPHLDRRLTPRPPDEELRELVRSMVEERILLLGRLKAHQDHWEDVLKVIGHPTGTAKLDKLLRIRALAAEALVL